MLRAVCVVAAVAAGAAAAPLPPTDPFLPGTRWAGTLTQRGVYGGGAAGPPTFRTVLTVTDRDGDRFEATLAEQADDVRVTYRVQGTLTATGGGAGYAVRFRSTGASDAENTEPVLGVPYDGVLTGKSLRGTWHVPTRRDGTRVEGGFELELAK